MKAIIRKGSDYNNLSVKPRIVLHLNFSIEEAEQYFATMQQDISDLIDNFKEQFKKRYSYCSEENVRTFKQNTKFNKDFLLSDFVFERELTPEECWQAFK